MKYSRLKLKAEGRNCNKVLVELMRKKVEVRDLVKEKECFYLTVCHDDYRVAKSVLQLFEVKYTVVGSSGLLKLVNKVKLNAIMIIGLIVGIAVISIISGFVMDIDINCTKPKYNAAVERLLINNGVTTGLRKASLDTKEIEHSIVSSIAEATTATVHFSGVKLIIDVVTENLPSSAPGEMQQVVSKCDAVVTRIITSSGTPLVKKGQTVAPGDVLIDGYIVTDKGDYIEEDSVNKVSTNATGEVYGKVVYKKRLVIHDGAIIIERTGNSHVNRILSIGDLILGGEGAVPYERYEKIVTYDYLNILFPIKVTTITYYKIDERQISKTEYKELMIAKAREELMGMVPDGALVLSDNVYDTTEDIIDIYYEVEQRIDNFR